MLTIWFTFSSSDKLMSFEMSSRVLVKPFLSIHARLFWNEIFFNPSHIKHYHLASREKCRCWFRVLVNRALYGHMSRLVTKPTKWHVRPAKTQISLGIHSVWSESSLCAQWVAKDPSFLHANSEDSDQTGRMPRLIWVFAGVTATLLVLSWGGSYALLSWLSSF